MIIICTEMVSLCPTNVGLINFTFVSVFQDHSNGQHQPAQQQQSDMAAATAAETEGTPRDPAAFRTPSARDQAAERAALRADRLQKRSSVAQPEVGRLHQRHDAVRRRRRRRLHDTAAHKHDGGQRSQQVSDDGCYDKRQLGAGLATAAAQDIVAAHLQHVHDAAAEPVQRDQQQQHARTSEVRLIVR